MACKIQQHCVKGGKARPCCRSAGHVALEADSRDRDGRCHDHGSGDEKTVEFGGIRLAPPSGSNVVTKGGSQATGEVAMYLRIHLSCPLPNRRLPHGPSLLRRRHQKPVAVWVADSSDNPGAFHFNLRP